MASIHRSVHRARRLEPQLRFVQRRCQYHSAEHPQSSPYTPTESAILSAALRHVPSHGFSTTSLRLGARDAGYLDASTNLFPRAAFDLIQYHCATRRLSLREQVQFPEQMGVRSKVRSLILARLRANAEARVVERWQEALAIMAQPSYVAPSLAELARLADEIWYLAGDASVDTSWYTKRASLSAIYSSAEIFQTQDKSPDYKETEHFVDARLEDLRTLTGFVGGLSQYINYTRHSMINLLRSKGMRI